MGTRTSRNATRTSAFYPQQAERHPPSMSTDQRCMNSPFNVMDHILTQHFMLITGTSEAQQAALNLHKQAVNRAMREHVNVAYDHRPTGYHIRQTVSYV